MKKRILRVALGFGVLLVLTGCNLAAKVVVQPNGSGNYSVIMTVPSESSNPGQVLYNAIRKGTANSDFPLTVTPYSSDGDSGAEITFHFLSLADLNAESHRLAAEGKGGIGVTINRDSEGWHFSAATPQSLIAPSDTLGTGLGSGSTGGLINGSQLSSLITIDLVIQLPGAPGVNNARTVAHTATTSTFTWNLSSSQPGSGLQASTTYVGNQANVKLASALTPVASGAHANSAGGSGLSGGTMGLAVGAAVVVIGAGAAALFLVVRRRKAVASVTGKDFIPQGG
jgi:hypothetical protein